MHDAGLIPEARVSGAKNPEAPVKYLQIGVYGIHIAERPGRPVPFFICNDNNNNTPCGEGIRPAKL